MLGSVLETQDYLLQRPARCLQQTVLCEPGIQHTHPCMCQRQPRASEGHGMYQANMTECPLPGGMQQVLGHRRCQLPSSRHWDYQNMRPRAPGKTEMLLSLWNILLCHWPLRADLSRSHIQYIIYTEWEMFLKKQLASHWKGNPSVVFLQCQTGCRCGRNVTGGVGDVFFIIDRKGK